ncbi:MAG: sugar ABC transporter permease [Chloroflexi bacterium]|nr:MAG: sugar ABC transporter permease [Chloroflexota bacterium]MBL1194404.1 sugar ABC transporter permease [Chloroflexota bacterium]NOH11692.1 sugar ABC transporter permease [Chloroflexota bacterium]
MSSVPLQQKNPTNFFNRFTSTVRGRRGRELREYLTAYLMIAPATLLIFFFGIFPVAFALFVSVHQWRLVRQDFLGLENFIKAVDSLTYIVLFGLGIGALFGVYVFLRRIYRFAQEQKERPWLLAVPSLGWAASVWAFFRWGFVQLPELLDIADKIRGLERTRELFVGLLGEAFRAENVYPAWQQFVLVTIVAIILTVAVTYFWRSRNWLLHLTNLTLTWLSLSLGAALLWVTFQGITQAYALAIETGEDPGIWPQLIMITSGVILLLLAWRLWNSVPDGSGRGAILKGLAALLLMLGAVLLILEIPSIVASGDPDLWEGLKITVFFSAGTVPLQLASALFLAVLLFQKLRGSAAFRIIFFLPYVTPAIASAAVFKSMFSSRFTSPANMTLGAFGIEPQLWIREPAGIVKMIGEGLGLTVPAWADGPSMALMVIILLSIWTFVGYNTVIYLAGLGNIPGELTEAAEIDGASKWEVFRHITFPLLSPTTYFLSLLAIIGTFKAFNTIWIVREGAALGTTDPFSVVIFIEFFQKLRYGYASALAFVLFAIIISLTLINNRIQGSRVFYG